MSDIDQSIAILKASNQWRSAEAMVEGRGAHRRPDGSWLFQVQLLVDAVLPDREAVQRMIDLCDGKIVEVTEAKPVTTGDQLSMDAAPEGD